MAIEREELYRLYEVEGLTIKEVSLQTGYSIGTIFDYLKKYGIKTRPRMTEATKAKISKSQKGRVSCRKGVKLSDEVKTAAQKYMVAPTHITRACRQKQRTVKTYHWEYVKEN